LMGAACGYFDGVNDIVKCTNTAGLNIGTNFTVAFWINCDEKTYPQFVAPIGLGRGVASIYCAGYAGQYDLFPYSISILNSSDSVIYNSGTNIFQPTTNAFGWRHIAVTYITNAATMATVYLDGRQLTVTPNGTPSKESLSTNVLASFGARFNSAAFFQGRLDEVRVYSRVLTSNEIFTGYSADVADAYLGDTVIAGVKQWIRDGFAVTTSSSLDVLAVGGGGSGATGDDIGAGGGGAGGLCYTQSLTLVSGTYPIRIGKGGVSSANPGKSTRFSSLVCVGGGAGGATYSAGSSGACGGGGGGYYPAGTYPAGGAGTVGFAGGNGVDSTGGFNGGSGGGGGGMGSAGSNATLTAVTNGGMGGMGQSNNITGTWTWYAGGGGGGAYNVVKYGASGGIGGGGKGGNGPNADGGNTPGTNGVANTGGGGGGGSRYFQSGGAGGSGIVIIKEN
jgi:hypothetical protein